MLPEYLHLQNLKVNKEDSSKATGGFFVIEENDAEKVY